MSHDKFREECGLIAIWNNREAANLAYLGLYAQQHRGQEGAGVVALDDSSRRMHLHRGLGLVSDVFGGFDFASLPGDHAIGHVRYTTAGGNILANVQPLYAHISIGQVAIAHNGNLINTDVLKEELIRNGAIFASTSDTEVFLHLLARAPKTPLDGRGSQTNDITMESLFSALEKVKGAYSLVILFEDKLVAVRDPNGFRPLSIGSLGQSIIVASETCAFDLIGARFIRDVAPGEVLEISGSGAMKSYFPFSVTKETPCIFEYVYFARPDSDIYGRNVYQVRKQFGCELAKEHPAAADMVIAVPDSGVTAAMGYAEQSGLPLEWGLIRNHYIGRTFIEPKQSIRDFGVKLKLNPNSHILKGKSVVVVDDSIVRGTTSRKLVSMLRQAGARELHMRISAPPTTDPCYYGIDTPQKNELIASHKSVEEIASFLGVDSLAYLSLEGMYRAVNHVHGGDRSGNLNANAQTKIGTEARAPCGFCDACFSGKYPVGTPHSIGKKQTALF